MAVSVAPDASQVASAYDLGQPLAPIVPAARGELGRIWSLETERGRWAVKQLWYPMSEQDARLDVAFQHAALAAGLLLPEPRLRADGSVLAEAGGSTVRVYAWADLTDRPPDPTTAAELLARLHALRASADGQPNRWFRDPVGTERWDELGREAATAGVSWAPRLAALVPELLAAEAVIAGGPDAPVVRCHLDFGPGNVVLDAHGRTVVIDWENSGPEVPERELAMTLLDWLPDDGAAESFLAAYEAAGGLGRLRDRGSFATALAVEAHLLEFYARRALAVGATEEDRQRSAWRIDSILERPITLTRIDALLDRLN